MKKNTELKKITVFLLKPGKEQHLKQKAEAARSAEYVFGGGKKENPNCQNNQIKKSIK